ncbi:MAG: response regulator [Chloroflexi bacterium]|nr:response regulator [Chloroflexota bacterium]
MAEIHALIIENNPFNAEVLERLLVSMGGSFTTVQDSMLVDSVISTLDRLDVVFLDLEMPKRDGYETLRILRQDFAVTAPIVAYTVHTSEMDEARAIGFDGFLGKPVDPARFPDLLSHILAGHSVWETP